MSPRQTVLAAAVAALAAAGWSAAAGATNECNGLQVCIRVVGPWVAVAPGEPTQYLLSCPRKRGVVGGLDAVATSRSVYVGFAGRLGGPVAPGMTTTRSALFRAVVRGARRQAFRPLLGCIPTTGGGRSTTALRPPPGLPLDFRARDVALRVGVTRAASIACPTRETLIGAWYALVFRTTAPPDPALAGAVRVALRAANGRVTATLSAGEALPASARAAVQIGAECAP